MAESGILDLVLFWGSQPAEVSKSLMEVTGKPALPQLFSLGYHQCRWNYNDEADVFDVDNNFDKYDIPYDVLWLDIEHTDGKKYFTWDKDKFPRPREMTDTLAQKGRKVC
jgi:alpha 1,3-glucosidase